MWVYSKLRDEFVITHLFSFGFLSSNDRVTRSIVVCVHMNSMPLGFNKFAVKKYNFLMRTDIAGY